MADPLLDVTTCAGIGPHCQYCGFRLPGAGEGPRECPNREEGTRSPKLYGSISGERGEL